MTQPIRRKKIPRNSSCPCGSGAKFKRCCGRLEPGRNPYPYPFPPELQQAMAEREGTEARRVRQQGRGRPIVSAEFKGHRMVAVGNTLHWSQKWRTFHDFLLDYIKDVLGRDWGNTELSKPEAERHPLIRWYVMVCEQQHLTVKKAGEVAVGKPTGAVTAYLNLAYCLYLLKHNVALQSRLVKRLRNAQQFYGAFYETMVAAHFIKAGFELALEDEGDPTSTHCEFTATFPSTGQKFSVEAKARTSYGVPLRPRIGRHLGEALRKRAPHPRVVFIDLAPPVEKMEIGGSIWRESVSRQIRKLEQAEGAKLPSALVFLTYDSALENLTTADYLRATMLDGFMLDSMEKAKQPQTLREALQWRKDHSAALALLKSIEEHGRVPAGFNGEIAPFQNDEDRLVIGRMYLVPQEGKADRVARLTDAVVIESESKNQIACVLHYPDDNTSAVCMLPMTSDELAQYRMDPDTYFGVLQKKGKKTSNPLELFDFFYENYSKTPTERLLELLKGHPRYQEVLTADREEIITTLCEGYVMSMVERSRQRSRQTGPAAEG